MSAKPAMLLAITFALVLPVGLVGQQPSKSPSAPTHNDDPFSSPDDRTVKKLRERTLPDPAHGYDWREAARKEGLSDKEIGQLAEKKILVTNRTFKQVFEPYNASPLPLFITSDSLLNGFHVLFEESVLRLELTNARRLGRVLKGLWINLQTADGHFGGKPQLVASGKRRAVLVLATALHLLGEKVELQADVAPLVREEVARIEAARDRIKPKWLGPPDHGFAALDYTRYEPRGFYAKRPSLQRYFRAVSWLQSIPFRVSNDEELVAILMLGRSVSQQHSDHERKQEIDTFFRSFDTLLGSGDNWHLLAAANGDPFDDVGFLNPFASPSESKSLESGSKTDELAKVRADFLERAQRDGGGAKINDQLAFIPDDLTVAAELSLRVLPARRTPDAMLFGRTTEPRVFHRDLPDGLELCAVLGSPFARSQLAADEQGKLIEEIDRGKPLFGGQSLYCEYLRCLEVLVAKPEPDAPPLMSGEAWQIKSCQTVLGGWVQLRHTWALQAKQNANWKCASFLPPGLVEPVPEFFARMARLSERTDTLLRDSEAFDPDPPSIAENLRKGMKALEKMSDDVEGVTKGRPAEEVSGEEMTLAEKVRSVTYHLPAEELGVCEEEFDKHEHQRVIELAEQLEQGRMPTDPSLVKALCKINPDLDSRWQTFTTLCRRLETLAHKQLRGAPFSKEENQFIEDYGATLAQVMFYDGNSYVHPNDDAPRVIDVYSNPNLGKFLEVGVARPRALYVLYPVKGREILCRGAVLPYYEFANKDRLTDGQWISLLDSHQRPKMPDWTRPIITPDPPSTSKP